MKGSAIPGPKGWELLKIGIMFSKDSLMTNEILQESFGEVVYCPWPNKKCLFVYHPDAAKHILKENQNNYVKSSEYQHLKPLLGEGLLTSEDEKWRKQRRIMAKEFHPSSIDLYVPKIQQKIQNSLSQIYSQKDVFDISQYFSSLTFQIAGDIFFGANVSDFSNDAREALEFETERVTKRIRRSINLPFSFPTPENCQGRAAIGKLDSIVEKIMKREINDGHNVLQKLHGSTPPLPAKTIRDEVMTLLLAGHETTSNLLTWTIYCLCNEVKWQDKIRQELQNYGKAANDLNRIDLTHLKVLNSAVKETLRLYPPIPLFSRTAKTKDRILGYEIEAGISVMISPWNIHRDAKYWEDPLKWNPERFLTRSDLSNDFTFIPFAKGARACIGEDLALVEAMIILAHMVENFDWVLASGFKPKAVQNLTLRSENGMLVKF